MYQMKSTRECWGCSDDTTSLASDEHRKQEETQWGMANRCECLFLVFLICVLLIGSLALVLFWVIQYHGGFAWTEDPEKQFNFHPVLMIAGFIFYSGFSMLLYRICCCCKKIYVKLLHTIFHVLAIPCIVLGFIAVLDYHNKSTPPIRNFYSLHSWIGFTAMGLFALQFVVGFFSFLILLCCESATEAFRAALVPIHSTFGTTTFLIAVAACVTGLTEKVLWTESVIYVNLPMEAIIVNTLGVSLVALGILIPCLVRIKPNSMKESDDYVSERL